MKPKPRAYGTGLITLDVVIRDGNPSTPAFFAGGTCGNVLTILSYLGWDSFPIARMRRDPAGSLVRKDLALWGVKPDLLGTGPQVHTPIIIENVSHDRHGRATHSFSFACPRCDAWLPAYRAVHTKSVEDISKDMESPRLFFFDRVSAGSIQLAKRAADSGALVMFEPTGIGNPGHFAKAVGLSHIVKYSADRLKMLDGIPRKARPPVEIVTHGREGLKFRTRLERGSSRWKKILAYRSERVIDAAGCGDWLTAVFLNRLLSEHSHSQLSFDSTAIEEALKLGQAAATWNCAFAGARGGMYFTRLEQFQAAVRAIRNGEVSGSSEVMPTPTEINKAIRALCPACTTTANGISHRKVETLSATPRKKA